MPKRRVKLDEIKTLPHAVFSDPIFFSKYNVQKGTYFRCFGRRNHGARYQVYDITTITSGKYGRLQHSVSNVRTLNDIIHLHCVDTGEWRQLRFIYMSYSAIWRLDD